MWTDLRDWLLLTDAGWWVGTVLIFGGITLAAVYAVRNFGDITMGPDPQLPTAPAAGTLAIASPPAPANYRRPDSDTGVIPRIPGATPETSAALDRYLDLVDQAAEAAAVVCDEIVLVHAEPVDDCPLTTQEIPPLDPAMPLYDTTVRMAHTQDLSAQLEKARQA